MIKLNNNSCNVVYQGETPLIIACRNKMFDVAKAILDTKKGLVNYIGPDGRTASMWVCENYTDTVKRELELMNSLIDEIKGTDLINLVDKNGETHLSLLIKKNVAIPNLKLYKLDYINKNGDNYLHIAIRSQNLLVAQELLKHKECDVGKINDNKSTPLLEACIKYFQLYRVVSRKNFQELIISMIETNRSKPEHKDEQGFSALFYGIFLADTKICHKLLDYYKFDPYDMSNGGMSLLNIATNGGMHDIVDRLKMNRKKFDN